MADFAVYAAGFFDGEGCVRIDRGRNPHNGRRYYALHVIVVNTYLPVLQELRERYGGVVKPRQRAKSHWKPSFQWRVCSKDALVFLRDVLPHLRVKRREAEIAIAFQEGMKKHGNRFSVTPPEVVSDRAAMCEELATLKRRSSKGAVN